MKIKHLLFAFAAFATFTFQLSTSRAQGTAFIYQGRLNSGGSPYTGSAEFQPSLWNDATNGAQVATNTPSSTIIDVTNGLFVLPLDFGVNFPGADRWLQLGVRTTIGPFTPLTPRQPLTPAPYAIFAGTASNLSGTLSAAQLGGTIATANLPDGLGGSGNTVNGQFAVAAGGSGNTASGNYATVPGGLQNIASGSSSFAAGDGAQAVHIGSFVWSDIPSFASTANYQFSVRAQGGIRLAGNVQLDSSTYRYLSLSGGNALGYLYGSFPAFADGIHLGYNYYADASGTGHVLNSDGATSRLTVGYGFVGIYVGGVNATPSTRRLLADATHIEVDGTFNNNSDRNAKQNFTLVSPSQILEKVAQLPLSEWSYKDDPTTRHVGPMAQDFHSAFNIGTDEKHIAPIDEGGVAFAAIQGLNQKLEQKETEITKLKQQNDSLEQRLDALEKIIRNQKSN